MMNYKKILAVSLAGAMVLGNASAVFAADKEGSATGEGETQYVAANDVFDVVFPTTADNATTFDYLLDPDGLISKTNGDRYTGKAFDDGKTVYFLRSAKVDGTVGGTAGTGNCDYTDTSDEIKVVNKSTKAVDLKVTAKVATVDGIKMAASDTFTDSEGTASTDTELYLALVGTDGTTPEEKAITADGTELTASIAADSNAYTVKWVAAANDGNGEYQKVLSDAAKAADYKGFKSYSFQVKGKCNTGTNIDWSGLTENAPKIDLVWSVKDFTVTGPQVTFATDGTITMSGLTADKNYANSGDAALLEYGEGDPYPLGTDANMEWITENWSTTTGGTLILKLNQAWLNVLSGKEATLTIKISDGTSITVTQQF